jgi:hypothetical protein
MVVQLRNDKLDLARDYCPQTSKSKLMQWLPSDDLRKYLLLTSLSLSDLYQICAFQNMSLLGVLGSFHYPNIFKISFIQHYSQ